VLGKHRIVIPMDLRHTGADLQFTGGSLALPVGIAVRHHCESGHDPLLVLSTGAVVDGRLSRVAGCEAKEALARKMGASIWFVPGEGAEEGGGGRTRRINLPEEPLDQVLEGVHSLLQQQGLAKLDVLSALRLLSRLRSSSATGRYPLEFLVQQAERCLKVFREDNHPTLQCDAIPETQILLAALENHAGRPHRAEEILKSVGDSMANDHRIGLKLIPYRVVSLSDMGRFDDAEMWGRKALAWALTLPEDRVGLEARIQASGSLGGDALLQKALRSQSEALARESRNLLEQNFDWATRLSSYCSPAEYRDDRNWAAMSAARVALWHAFFEPENITDRIEQAKARIKNALGQTPPKDSSRDYLSRTALLGCFRALLKGSEISHVDWPLPSDEAPHWVRATALKYRAALYASCDRFDEALRDFKNAYELLRLDRTPVIQTICWSIAAQAVLSLPEIDSAAFNTCLREDRQYVVDYLNGHKPSRALAQIFNDGHWERTHLMEFQRGFAY
jgi:tetratricopeptide (TPR) repeat protein